MKYINLPIAAITALSTSIISTQSYSQDRVVDDVIIVTANRRPQPLSQVGSSVSVLTSDDLERNQQSYVLDALETIPGVAISQNGSFGGTASVSIRGAGSGRTVLMIDGVQLNDASSPGGAYNFGTLDTYNIERVEVLRGPQSTLYGSDAIGGVINIITKTGGDGLGGKMFLEGGSFNAQRGGASLHGGDGKFGFNLSASGTNTDGISAADENDGNSERDGLRSYSFNGKLTGQLSEKFKLDIISRYSDNRTQFDNPGPVDGTTDRVSNIDEFSGTVRGHLSLLEGRFENTLSSEYTSIDRENFNDEVSTFQATGQRINFDYLGVFTINSDWTVTSGLQREAVKSRIQSPDYISTNSAFGEVAFTGLKGLVLTSGVRYDDHETFGNKTSFRATASYEIEGTGTRLIANWGEGFKAPTIFQLNFVIDEIPTILRPERAKGYEIGAEQTLANGRAILNATYFNSDIVDAIEFVATNPFPFRGRYENIDRVKSQGIELSGQFEVHDTLDIGANYTYTDAKDSSNSTRLAREPEHRITGSIQWRPIEKVAATLIATHNSSEEQDFGAVKTLDGWTRVDIRASYQIMDDLIVYGRVDNLFNKEYQHTPGYGTPDRSYFAGLRKEF